MYISGSMGYTLFKYMNKKILLFSDIHDGVNYCSNADSQFISEYLYNHSGKNKILLEEAVKDDSLKLRDLWPNSKHTQELKQLSIKYQKEIISTDIRPLFIPFSWEVAEINSKYYSIPIKKYLERIDSFFNNKNDYIYNKYFNSHLCNDIVSTHFNELKNKYLELRPSANIHKTIGYFKENYLNCLYNINNILDLILELYMIILIICGEDNTYIIHTGIAHSSRMTEFMKEYYKFEIIKQSGTNEIKHIKEPPLACLYLPTDVKDMFNKKVHLF